MPRVQPKPKFKDDQLVVCWTDFAADDVPPPGVIKRGTKLRGDHPAVRAHSNYFVDANTPDDHIPSPFTFMADPPEHEHEFIQVLERLPDDQLMEATVDFSPGLGSEVIRKGTRLPKDDWRVRRVPEWFKPVIEEAK
jgi:hypothetical protein